MNAILEYFSVALFVHFSSFFQAKTLEKFAIYNIFYGGKGCLKT